MSRTSLKARIYAFLRTKPGIWVARAEIERLTFDNSSYIASNATRRLRELHEEKPDRVEREYRKGKHGETLAWYRYVPSAYELYKTKVDGLVLGDRDGLDRARLSWQLR